MVSAEFVADLQPAVRVSFFADTNVFCVLSNKIKLYFATGTVVLNFPNEIDRVTELSLIKLPETDKYLLCVFG